MITGHANIRAPRVYTCASCGQWCLVLGPHMRGAKPMASGALNDELAPPELFYVASKRLVRFYSNNATVNNSVPLGPLWDHHPDDGVDRGGDPR
jgi:hypothetical protein